MAADAVMFLLGTMMIEQRQKLQQELDRQKSQESWTGQIVGEAFEPQESVLDATGDGSR